MTDDKEEYGGMNYDDYISFDEGADDRQYMGEGDDNSIEVVEEQNENNN